MRFVSEMDGWRDEWINILMAKVMDGWLDKFMDGLKNR